MADMGLLNLVKIWDLKGAGEATKQRLLAWVALSPRGHLGLRVVSGNPPGV